MKTFPCQNCGLNVPQKAKACPHCGSDEKTGWSEQTYLDGLGIYDEEDYQNTLYNEGLRPKPKSGKGTLLTIIVIILLILFVFIYILHMHR